MSELSMQDLQAILADREARIGKLERDLEAARAGEASMKAEVTRMAKENARLKGVLAGMGLE